MEKDISNLVDKMVKEYNLELEPEHRYIDLVSEVGELGKELLKATNYGKEKFVVTKNTESEIGDILFSLTCIANSLSINVNQALIGSMQKYEKRFKQKGHTGSE